MALKDDIRNFALQNAIKFDGKAQVGAVIGKILAMHPDQREYTKELAQHITKVIKNISSMSVTEMTKELKKKEPALLEEKKRETEKELAVLKNASVGKVVMRFEPSPSGPLHIGHAYVLSLNAEYTKQNKGKLILRIADTNPDNIYAKAYELIPEDAQWLTEKGVSEVIIQSDRLEIYYNYMERLIDLDKAYVCICDPDAFKKLLHKSEACPCRGLNREEQRNRWKKMFKEYKKGDAVVRIKTDLNDKNPAMRDFPVFRIVDSEHPKQGTTYRVWPLMNMAVTCDDIESGITHVIRAKDHADNAKRQKILFDYLGKKFPETMFVGRINFEDMPVSATKTRIAIEENKFIGWDDIRLPFLQALQKRGYKPGAFVKYAIEIGMSLTDKKVSKEDYYKTLNAFNKDIIDPKAYRYFFVSDPVKISIEKAPNQEVELDLQPDNKKGGRLFETKQEFYITQEDFDVLEDGNIYRLMDCLNFEKKKDKFKFHSKEYAIFKEIGKKIFHWIPANDHVNVKVLMEDNTIKSGLGEKSLKSVKVGNIVQLERFGFCKLIEKR